MPPPPMTKKRPSVNLHKIEAVAASILRGHNGLRWGQRTRSNKGRPLETIYFAIGELEIVLNAWRNCYYFDEEERQVQSASELKAKRAFVAAFKPDLTKVSTFLDQLTNFKQRLLDAFLKPLVEAFPVALPHEILVKIWTFSQPQLTLSVSSLNLVEARKFLLLLKTTVLSVYNTACKQKHVGSMPVKRLLQQCVKNFDLHASSLNQLL